MTIRFYNIFKYKINIVEHFRFKRFFDLLYFAAFSSGKSGRGGWVFGLVPFSTCSHSGENALRQIHLSWKIWRAALLSAAANFPHLPVVPLTTPATLPRSKAALRRRQESSGEQRCAHRPGGARWAVHFKGARRFQWTRRLAVRRCFKAVLVVFLPGIAACCPQWRLETGRSRHLTTGVCSFPLVFSSCVLSPFQTSHSTVFL